MALVNSPFMETEARPAGKARPALPARVAQQWQLISWDELPEWAKDNELIDHHYRTHADADAVLCLRSVFKLHNETMNIWTHFGGFLCFLGVFASLFAAQRPEWTGGDTAAWACFAVGCLGCLGCSSIFHILMNHSNEMFRRTITLDYLGIVILIWGSNVVATRFLFWCDTTMQLCFMGFITAFGVSVMVTMLVPKFMAPKYRVFRAVLFTAMGGSGLVPILVFTVRHADSNEAWHISQLLFGMLGSYGLGVVIYAMRFPECLFPGKVNLFFASHQWMHVAVLSGCVCHYEASIAATARVHSEAFSC
jgi:adiponectin receptor